MTQGGRAKVLICIVLGLTRASPVGAFEVGQPAPHFTLAAPGGRLLTLADLLGKGPIILYVFQTAYNQTCIDEMGSFDKSLARFEAAGVQLVGVSPDHVDTLDAIVRANKIKHLLLSDFRKQMLPAYGALVTDPASPVYGYGKRAYFVIDRQGIIRYRKVEDNPLDLLKAEELLRAFKETGL